MNEIVKIITTLLFLVCPGGGISSTLAYSGVAHNSGGLLLVVGVIGLLRSLVTVTQSTETKEGSGRNGWRVYVLQKSTPRRVGYNWVVDLGE